MWFLGWKIKQLSRLKVLGLAECVDSDFAFKTLHDDLSRSLVLRDFFPRSHDDADQL